MRKIRIKRILSYITSITTGTLIACIVWYGLTMLERGEPLSQASLPYVTLPEILLLGTLCGIETDLLLPCRESGLKEERIRRAAHMIFITVTALVCGYFYGWYERTFPGILLMCLTSACIYLFVRFVSYWNYKKEADKMNEGLKEYRKEKGERTEEPVQGGSGDSFAEKQE